MGKSLGELTTNELAELLGGGRRVVALIGVGSVEPHGPHLPLATDTVISAAAIARARELLHDRGVFAIEGPPVPYGVTDFAEGFAGAISVTGAVLEAFLRAVVRAYLDNGFAHVCLVNNHLEPAHDAAVRAATREFPRHQASVACPLTKRWARTLSDEFKSGACHAGRYETSVVLAATPGAVDRSYRELPEVPVSLSDGIKNGLDRFRTMGMSRAYAGAPAEASADEGRATIESLATMVATEVEEALATGEP